MPSDIVRQLGYLTLGSRLKRIGERMQADVGRLIDDGGLPIQPGQCPILAALDTHGPLTVNQLAEALGISQPGVTRAVAQMTALGLVEMDRRHRDQRLKTIALTAGGRAVVDRLRSEIWPRIEAAVRAACAGRSGPLLDQLDAIEAALDEQSLHSRAETINEG